MRIRDHARRAFFPSVGIPSFLFHISTDIFSLLLLVSVQTWDPVYIFCQHSLVLILLYRLSCVEIVCEARYMQIPS